MRTTYLVAYDMLARNGARRTYSRWFTNQDEAERHYKLKRLARTTIEIWMIKSDVINGTKNYEYIHKPEYVWI
jgi:hypothetical protein